MWGLSLSVLSAACPLTRSLDGSGLAAADFNLAQKVRTELLELFAQYHGAPCRCVRLGARAPSSAVPPWVPVAARTSTPLPRPCVMSVCVASVVALRQTLASTRTRCGPLRGTDEQPHIQPLLHTDEQPRMDQRSSAVVSLVRDACAMVYGRSERVLLRALPSKRWRRVRAAGRPARRGGGDGRVRHQRVDA
jgi:hypothetical protein